MAITISGDSPNFTSVAATTITNVTNISSNAADTPVILGDSGTNYNTCRAWVNFNGTGTVAIRADFNVTSITDNGTGDYTVNFTNAMPDANYVACATSVQRQTASASNQSVGYYSTDDENATTYSTTAVRISTKLSTTTGFRDTNTISVAIFR